MIVRPSTSTRAPSSHETPSVADILGQFLHASIPPLGFLLHRPVHDLVQIASDGRYPPAQFLLPNAACCRRLPRQSAAWSRRIDLVQNPVDLHIRCPLKNFRIKRRRIGQQLIKKGTECINIGPGIHVSLWALRLLRAHVLRGAQELRLLNQPLACSLAAFSLRRDALGDPKVDDLD